MGQALIGVLVVMSMLPAAPAGASGPSPDIGGGAAKAAVDPRAARRTPVVEVFESCRNAVVNISSRETVTVRNPFGFDSFFEDSFDMPRPPGAPRPGTRQYTRTSVGSGFVIHPDGYIVTNAHVISQTADRKAIFSDGREFDAQVVAFDTTRDLAVLKIEADRSLPTLRLGRSNDLMIGETVIAIGNPLGLQNTVTAGVISATGRDLELSREHTLSGLIQTDASINPGNSGGPLLNVTGELIGVNTAIRGDAQNIGFAIPVDQLRELLPDLLDVERRYHIVSGMSVGTLDWPRVDSVRADSPADTAGVKVGDVLCQIDGRSIAGGIDFCIALIGRKAGETLALTLQREGQPVQVDMTLLGRPAPDGAKLALDKLGLSVAPLPEDVARDLSLPEGTGLLITGVEMGSPAEQLRLRRRDVLVALGRHYVSTLEELGQLLEQINAGENVPLTVLRTDRRTIYRLTGQARAR